MVGASPGSPVRRSSRAYVGLRALVADSSEAARLLHSAMLQDAGFSVTCVDDGSKAARFFGYGKTNSTISTSPFDVVFLTMNLNCLDGVATACAIRRFELRAGIRRTPIVVISDEAVPCGDPSTAPGAHGFGPRAPSGSHAAGAALLDEVLEKPVKPESLRAVLEKLFMKPVAL